MIVYIVVLITLSAHQGSVIRKTHLSDIVTSTTYSSGCMLSNSLHCDLAHTLNDNDFGRIAMADERGLAPHKTWKRVSSRLLELHKQLL